MKKLIKIDITAQAIFKDRPNRYIAHVDVPALQLKDELVHVHDPGRLTELLFSGNSLLIKRADNPNRKTAWDVIAAKADEQWVLIHTAYHRKIMEALLNDPSINPLGSLIKVQAEVKYKNSRIDFFVTNSENKQYWIEGKGCCLVKDGIALFPDAPSKRATKHLYDLMELKAQGYGCAVYILIFNSASQFRANHQLDPLFAETFYKARDFGVKMFAVKVALIDEHIIYEGILNVG